MRLSRSVHRSATVGRPVLPEGKRRFICRAIPGLSLTTCHTVNAALWALLIAGTAFLLFQIPEMRKARAIAEAQHLRDISEENKSYCEKWGMPARSHEHVICTMGLGHIRKQIEKRIADEAAF